MSGTTEGVREGSRWLVRVHDILVKCGFGVVRVVASESELDVTMMTASGGFLTLEMRDKGSISGFCATTDRCAFRVRGPTALSPVERAALDLAVRVLQRLEPRLPADRHGFAVVGEPLDDSTASAARRFPFATVEQSDSAGRIETEVMVRLTPICNQQCPFCSAPPHRKPAAAEYAACLDWAARTYPGARLSLTGGEPTLSGNFVNDLRAALAHPEFAAVEVQTNAVGLARGAGADALPIDPRLTFFVSLHALDPDVYDRCTGTHGQLPLALDGIRRLLESGRPVCINVVLSSLNLAHLPDLVEGLPRVFDGLPLPRLHFSSLMCPVWRPEAAEFLVRYCELAPALEKALAMAFAAGIVVDPLVSSTHASPPLCLVGTEEREAAMHRPELAPGETGYEDFSRPWVKAASCRACRYTVRCLGVPVPYARRFGFGELKPVPVDEVVLIVTRRLLDEPDRAVAAVTRPVGQAPRVVLEVPRIEDVPEGDEPVALSQIERALPDPVLRPGGRRAILHSRVGRPLCLFPESLMRVLLGQPGGREGVEGSPEVFGPACADCSLRRDCSGVSRAYAKRFGFGELKPFGGRRATDATWEDRVRLLLLERPTATVALRDLIPHDRLPHVRCVLPWTRLELHEGGLFFGPCCADYMARTDLVPEGADPMKLWNGEMMQSFRQALLSGEHPWTCRETCPILAGGTERAEELRLAGGPSRLVEAQIQMVQALSEGSTVLPYGPLGFAFPATSFCDFDCLMCHCGETGTLDDQKPAKFYKALDRLVEGMSLIEVNGGEPFASPTFRAFVDWLAQAVDGRRVLSVITNGSLLTPRWLARYPRLPFVGLVVSLNAATPETYQAVSRGRPWSRIRANLDELLRLRREGRLDAGITYSMVLLRRNVHEIEAFARMGMRDGVDVRFLLPVGDRNAQSVMTSRETMEAALEGLRAAARVFEAHGRAMSAKGALGNANVLADRLAHGRLTPIGVS